MPEKVSYDGGDCIHIRSWGDLTVKEMLESARVGEELHEKHGVRKLLVDALDLIVFPRIGDSFDLAEEISRREALLKYKVAVAISPVAKGRVEFYQSALKNRGLNIQLFDTLEKAKEWLDDGDE